MSAGLHSASRQKIPLPEDLAQIIADHRSASTGYFLTGSSQDLLEPRTMQDYFKRVFEKCSIDPANLHSLRHTFATRCVELGFDVKSLSEILGHANVTTTLDRYVHPSMGSKQENMQRFSSLFAVR